MWGVYYHFRGHVVIVGVTDTFLVPGDDSTEVQRVRYTWTYILQNFGGYLMPDKSQNLVHLG
ncbi:hypothetical protein Gotur_005921 [Gossypium turneri]